MSRTTRKFPAKKPEPPVCICNDTTVRENLPCPAHPPELPAPKPSRDDELRGLVQRLWEPIQRARQEVDRLTKTYGMHARMAQRESWSGLDRDLANEATVQRMRVLLNMETT